MNAPALIAAACLSVLSCTAAAETVPKPKLRPVLSAAPVPETVNRAVAAPIPRLRPAAGTTDKAEAPPKPTTRPGPLEEAPQKEEGAEPGKAQDAAGDTAGWPSEVIAAEKAICRKLLDGLDIAYTPLDPIGRQGGCGAPAPIEVTRVAGVALSPPATQTCAMAAAMAAWVSDDVKPAARRHLGAEVTEIRTATSYACRRRNNGSSGKMSEHSKANALDMSGFTFAKQPNVTVSGSGSWGDGLLAAAGLSKNGSFLGDIRKASCTHFTTVLGPGSDPFHGDHFHVDVLQRKGGYRICQ